MISFFFMSTLLFFFNCIKKNNPVKMKMSLMASSFFIFLTMKILTSNAWLPLIFVMLYLGGILMMFMMLSSFLPNTKMTGNINNKFMVILMILISMPNSMPLSCISLSYKVFMEDKINFIFMTIWILSVFFGFILILSDCNISMRSVAFN